ncbi:hypothetical protein [Glycomyces salinus]|uniref:hypothetical protein n=1 Tax=Glycomyces salinus TaxID=980294 RepID=UPI0018EAD921|nr:hypothetical protein [Glycomyces salinus]
MTGSARTGGAWARALTTAAAALVAVLAAAGPARAQSEETGEAEQEAEGIVVVGVPGLSWSDIDPADTPTLWDLAGDGATGAMSVRTIGAWTCPEAGWVSLGAGARAGGLAAREAHCQAQSAIPEPVSESDAAALPWWPDLQEANVGYNYGARLGALAEAIEGYEADQAEAAAEAEAEGEPAEPVEAGLCVSAIGPGAALAAADPEGGIDFWGPDLDSLPEAMAACDVVIVDPGLVVGEPSEPDQGEATTDYDALGQTDTDVPADQVEGEAPDPTRQGAAEAADRAVATVAEALPDRWRLLVAGIADAAAPSGLHPVIYSGSGVEPGDLRSATTGRDGYIQLVDLAPTVLDVVGADVPAAMSGRPIGIEADDEHTAESAVERGVDVTAASAAVSEVGWSFYVFLAAAGAVGAAAAAWLVTGPDRWRRTAAGVCVAVSVIPVAGIAAGMPPWWRAESPPVAFWAFIAAGVALVTALSYLPGLREGRRRALLVSGIAAGLIAFDQIAGTMWPLHTPMGYTASVGARFSGLSNYAFAVFAAAVILIITLTPWRGRGLYFGPVAVGLAAVAVVGAPVLGRNVGGTLTLVAALVLTCLLLWGRRLSIGAVAAAGAIAAGVLAAAGFIDYLRPESDQTHLGRFVGTVISGDAGEVLARKAASALGTIGGPLTYLIVAAAVALVWIWRRRGPIATRRHQAAAVGLLAVAVIGFSVNDSGTALPAFAISLGFGLFAVAVGPVAEPARSPGAAVRAGQAAP